MRNKIAELESLLQALPDLYFRLARDGTILDYHAGNKADLYLPPEGFLNKRMQDVMPPNIGNQFLQAVKMLDHNLPLTGFEYSLVVNDERKFFEARVTPLGSHQVIVVVRDITDRIIVKNTLKQIQKNLEKRVEQRTAELSVANEKLQHEVEEHKQTATRLREKNAFLQLLQNIAVTANESKCLETALATALEQVCIYTDWQIGHAYLRSENNTHDLIPSNIWYSEHPELFEEFKKLTANTPINSGVGLPGQAFATKKPACVTNVNIPSNCTRQECVKKAGIKSGFAFPVFVGNEVSAVLEFFSTKVVEPDQALLEIVSYVGTQLGRVTERHQSEEDLRKSETRFRRLFENAADAIYLHDQKGRLIDVNRKACEAIGYTREEILQMFVWDIDAFYKPEQLPGIWSRFEKEQVNSIKLDSAHKRKNGSVFPVEIQLAKIEMPNQTLILALARDMTEHKKAQAILQNTRDELERHVEQRTAELSSTNTRLQREIAERKRLEKAIADRMTDEQRAIGQALHDGLAQQLTGTAMLAQTFHSKLKTASSPLAKSAIELTHLINDARDQVRSLINGLHPVEVDVDGLKAALQKLAVSTERLYGITCAFEYAGPLDIQENNTAMQLYYIAREALNNAVKHAKPTKIVIGVMADGSHSILYVRDNGIGINADSQTIDGMGLKIMNYRAGLVGADLKIHRVDGGGTLVSCTL